MAENVGNRPIMERSHRIAACGGASSFYSEATLMRFWVIGRDQKIEKQGHHPRLIRPSPPLAACSCHPPSKREPRDGGL